VDEVLLEAFRHNAWANKQLLARRPTRMGRQRRRRRSLDELERRADENAQVWERFLSQPLGATTLIILDQGAYEAEQSVLVVQAFHHGNAHREQICAIMTSLGVQPPDIQAWSYAEATGHARERAPN
jgi:uncharacterized damage-inducible protein DinB